MYRFAFDLGTRSIGWAVFRLDDRSQPMSLEKLGVRILPNGRDPESKESKAAGRPGPGRARRRQDRKQGRRRCLLDDLIRFGLLPFAADALGAAFAADPVEARARAAREPVSPEQLGRALLRIWKHRGFRSKRRIDREADEDGKIAKASKALVERLEAEGHPTYDAFLHARRVRGEGTRIRPMQ